jgi:translocation protein SEC63
VTSQLVDEWQSPVFSNQYATAWYSIASRVCDALSANDESIGALVRTTAEAKKAEQLKQTEKGLAKLRSKTFLIHLGVTILLTSLAIWTARSISLDSDPELFDPFSILGIDAQASNEAIKVAYRALALKLHPDHNREDPLAEEKFIQLQQAYKALTDEEAKRNLMEHGNIDGNQSIRVGLGLPSYLLDSKYRNLVLVVYLIIVVGLIPYFAWSYYSNSTKYGEKDVLYDTFSWYHHALSEHTIVKLMPEILAGSAEFRKRNTLKSVAEKEVINELLGDFRGRMHKPKYNHPVCVKGNVLLHYHLLRQSDGLTLDETEDLRFMLRESTSLIDAMISVCKHQGWMQTAIKCIDFGQYITQAMWVNDSPLLQLPHFTKEQIKHCTSDKKAIRSVQELRQQPEDQRKGMAEFTSEQMKDVANYLTIFPDVTVATKIFVDDDEDPKIYEGDLVTLQVNLTSNNFTKNRKCGLVHAPHYPFPKRESWWILLGQVDSGKIISAEKIESQNHQIEHQIKFMAPPQGSYEFDLVVKSSDYIGCDYSTKITIECLDNATLPEYKIHPEDAKLDDEPTLWEELMNVNVEDDSDDDSDDDVPDDDEDARRLAADAKRERLRLARQAVEDDEEEVG